MKKEIYYWSPFLGRVATIRSVINSMIGLKRYYDKHYKINLINCYGEWNSFSSRLKREKINILNIQKKFNLNVDISGFFFSRLVYFFTLLVSYNKLKNLLIKNQPDFLIVHLLTYIPFIIYVFKITKIYMHKARNVSLPTTEMEFHFKIFFYPYLHL